MIAIPIVIFAYITLAYFTLELCLWADNKIKERKKKKKEKED